MNLTDIQKMIETMSFTDACAAKQEQQESHVKRGQEFNLSYGQEIIKEILPVAEAYTRELYTKRNQHTKPFYWEVIKPRHEQHLADKAAKLPKWERMEEPAIQMSEVAAVLLVAKLSKGVSLKHISESIANNVMRMFNIPFDEFEEWKHPAISYFSMMVTNIAESTDIFRVEAVEKREHLLLLSDEWKDKVEEIQGQFGLNVSKFKPMVVVPTPHTNLVSGDGGYLCTQSPLLKFPVREKGNIHKTIANFTSETAPDWFAAINKAQSTPYCVNQKLLEVITDAYEGGLYFADFPIEVNFADVATSAQEEVTKRNEKRKKYALENGNEYAPLLKSTVDSVFRAHQSNAVEQVRKTNALFEQAEAYRGYPAIFFPLFVDYRGRRYPYANTSLSFQGDEMAKALLQFSNKKVITESGEVVLFETLANTMGKDKQVCEIKEAFARKWFYANLEHFMGGDFSMFFTDSLLPKEDRVFDEPVNALAIVLELVEYTKNPDYLCGYIAHRDARCSGASIIGTILRDEDVMKMTSVIDWADENGKLGDAYARSAEKAMQGCNYLASKGNTICQELMEVADKLFTRSVFKFVVMTKSSYGATDYGMRQYNKSVINWEEEGLTAEHKSAFDSIMMKALDAALPSCTNYLDAAKEAAKQFTASSDTLNFINPVNGFPVVHKEFKTEKRILAVVNNMQRIRLTLITPTDKINKQGMISAFSPNLIHSLDVALLNLVEGQVECDLSLIHDSLGSHPSDTKSVVVAYSRSMGIFSANNIFQIVFDEMGVDVKLPITGTFKGKLKESNHAIV